MKTLLSVIRFFLGKSQGFDLPNWIYYLLPLWNAESKAYIWLGIKIRPRFYKTGDTLFMALFRKKEKRDA